MKRIETLKLNREYLEIIDQRRLPSEKKLLRLYNEKEVGEAIQDLAVRGAPAIGIAGAMGVYLGIKAEKSTHALLAKKDCVIEALKRTRPTAVNLYYGLEKVGKLIESKAGAKVGAKVEEIKDLAYECVGEILESDLKRGEKIGRFGQELLRDGSRVMTHCNAGGLATSGYGTALSPIYMAKLEGKKVFVYVNETRPLFQGSRLTAWELMEQGIEVTLICDSSAGYVMSQYGMDLVIVGADRISMNGDIANKIGTYSLAIHAKEHQIPFYVAAPETTFDRNIKTGENIPIEERDSKEVTEIFGHRIAPLGVKVYSPAFDITPNKYITGIITEKGILYPPFQERIKSFLS